MRRHRSAAVPFSFGFGTAQRAFTSLRDMSLRRNASVVASARRDAPSRRCAA
jgi:hypothetical protein